ncbi:MAG: 16S rRNA (cytosine(1402)-N(4))-methyltransferase RsmH [Lentisphaerae bacterium]|jgi:16S rRNA (cytosine1402-N4)-methyltransferase|nr:16S rRNA (cytosine(1402)-N(4))-methyltransferase RsmH [Lentisphaerota bacterium]
MKPIYSSNLPAKRHHSIFNCGEIIITHKPVLLEETIEALSPKLNGTYIDGTIGGGGHAEALLNASGAKSRLMGIDRDPDAVERCKARLSCFGDRFVCVHSDFASMTRVAQENGFNKPDGILLDLGVSSFQIDEPERGFSFIADGPLDMRMDNSKGMTVAEYLDMLEGDWQTLATVLRQYGEEPRATKIAKAIAAEQVKSPIKTTARLASIVEKAVGGRKGAPRHPATRTFQALRIAINAEMEQLRDGLESAISLLAEDGRLAVISFHSIEDRIVKQTFRAHEGRTVSLQQGGTEWEGKTPVVVRVNRRAIKPSDNEISKNPRARSAKLRAVRRIQTPS